MSDVADTPQPQTGLTLREQVARTVSEWTDDGFALADAVIPLVAKAQREADVAALHAEALASRSGGNREHGFGLARDALLALPLISEPSR